jgi:hypothetical protein
MPNAVFSPLRSHKFGLRPAIGRLAALAPLMLGCMLTPAATTQQQPPSNFESRAIWGLPITDADHCLPLKSRNKAVVWKADVAESMRMLDVNGVATQLRLPDQQESSCSIVDVTEGKDENIWITMFVCEEKALKIFLVQASGTALLRAEGSITYRPAEEDFISRVTEDGSLIASWPSKLEEGVSRSLNRDTFITVPAGGSDLVQAESRPDRWFEIDSFVSFGDGEHFLLTSHADNGVWLFSTLSNTPPRQLLASTKFRIGSHAPRKTAVIGGKRGVVILDVDNRPFHIGLEGAHALSSNHSLSRVQPAEDDRRVWTISETESVVSLWVFETEPGVIESTLSPRYNDPVPRVPLAPPEPRRISIIPASAAGFAWVILQGRPGAFIYDVRTKAWLRNSAALQGMTFSYVYRLADGDFLLEAQRGSVFLAAADGTLLNEAIPLQGHIETNSVRTSERYGSAFDGIAASTDQRIIPLWKDKGGFTLIDNKGRRVVELAEDTLRSKSIHNVYPSSDFQKCWIDCMTGLYLFDALLPQSSNNSVLGPVDLGKPAWRDVYPVGEDAAWVISEGALHYLKVAAEPLRIIHSAWGSHHKVREGRGFWPTSLAGRAWVVEERTSNCYLIGTDALKENLRVSVGGVQLDAANMNHSQRIKVDPSDGIAITFEGVLRHRPADANGVCRLQIRNGTGEVIATRMQRVDDVSSQIHFDWPSELTLPTTGAVSVTFEDRYGTEIHFDWPLMTLVPRVSLWETPTANAVYAWLLMIAVILLSQTGSGDYPLRKFIPAALAAICSLSLTGSRLANIPLKINLLVFWCLFIATVVLLVLVGGFNARTLRRLANIFPFDLIIPPLLQLRIMRLRHFGPYIDELEGKLHWQRVAAMNEEYVAIPVGVRAPAEAMLHRHPDREVANALIGTSRSGTLHIAGGRNVLIMSPGGQGKSALLRRVVELLIERFRSTGLTPIPIFCTGTDGNLEAAAKSAIGAKYVIDSAFKAQLDAGFFVLVIDGLSEQGPSAPELESFIQSDSNTRLLASTRPHPGYEAVFMTTKGMVVEPQRLTSETIEHFEENYLGSKQRLSTTTRAACAGPDGSYLPVLVRFAASATRAGGADLPTVADIFAAAFETLLKRPGQLKAAAELCLATYWDNGCRTIPAHIPEHQEIVDSLSSAGVLIADKLSVNRASNEPTELRFFHDSMQTFLTATGLQNLPSDQKWECLVEAAGDIRFTNTGSELFQMCIQVFRPRYVVRKKLSEQLLLWAEQYFDCFSATQIIDAASSLGTLTVSQSDTIKYLLGKAVASVDHEPADAAIRHLAMIYAHLAQTVWSRKSLMEVASN